MAQTIPANPDYHFLIFAPGLESWVFPAAAQYWATYRPILYTMRAPDDLELVTYTINGQRQVAVTLALRRDTADAVRSAFATRMPSVYLDPLVYDPPIDLQITLDARAAYNHRFGVPADGEGTPSPLRSTPGPITLP